MIVKKHEIPITLLKLAGLTNRSEPNHPKYQTIVDDLNIYQSGYRGELAFDYYLRAVDSEHYGILHSLRITDPNTFQVDTLILTPCFILIVEVKNFTGTIEFDHQFGQMIQHSNGRTRSFKDPISQVENHTFHLQNFLSQHGFSAIPIESLVVFVSNHVHLTRKDGQQVDERIIHAGKFMEKFQELSKKYTNPILSHQQVQNLAQLLKNRHRPLNIDILKKYKLGVQDLKPGAPCPSCYYLPNTRLHGRWFCPNCQNTNKEAHIYAFKDAQLLIKDTLTNREARWWLQVDDVQVVSKLLLNAGYDFTGYKKDRTYQLNYDYQRDYSYLMKNR